MNDLDMDERLTTDARRWRELTQLRLPLVTNTDALESRPAPQRRGYPTRLRWLLAPVAAGMAAVAVATVAHVVVNYQPALRPTPAATTPAADTTAVNYLGVTFHFPARWTVHSPASCWPQPAYSVVTQTSTAPLISSCPSMPITSTPAPAQPQVQLITLSSGGLTAGLVATSSTPTRLAGLAATRSTGVSSPDAFRAGADFTFVQVQDQDLGIVFLDVPDADVAAILASARLGPTDTLGCRDHVTNLTPTGNPPAATLVPPTPVSAVVCEYLATAQLTADARLIGSRVLTASERAEVLAWVARAHAVTGDAPSPTTPFAPLLYVFTYPNKTTRTIQYDARTSTATDGQRSIGIPYESDQLPAAIS